MYADRFKPLLSSQERKIFQSLRTPQKIQDFLDTLPINFEETKEGVLSPRRVLREKKAHCLEGALFAAASLAYHGYSPLLMDFRTLPIDEDHVVAIFKQDGLWGAISKTNHAILRWRDPVYKSIRELAMSYFHEYLLWNGKKSLLAYSGAFDLRRYDPQWIIAEEELEWIAEDLDDARHYPIAPKAAMRRLRRGLPIERKAMELVEWNRKKRIPYTMHTHKKENSH